MQDRIESIDENLMVIRLLTVMRVKISPFSSKLLLMWQADLGMLGPKWQWEGLETPLPRYGELMVLTSHVVVSVSEEKCHPCTVTAKTNQTKFLQVVVDLYINIFHEMHLQTQEIIYHHKATAVDRILVAKGFTWAIFTGLSGIKMTW